MASTGGAKWNKVFVAQDLPDPVCEGSMIAFGNALLFSNAGSKTDRRDLTVSASFDGGQTWPAHVLVKPGSAAYSDLVLLPKSQLGILWERGNKGGIFFTTRDAAPLMRKSVEPNL